MKDADFELIMAYADGETGAEASAKAEALLAKNPAARAALARLRAVDNDLKSSLQAVLHEPVPQRLVHAATLRESAGGRLLHLPQSWRSTLPQWSLAASLVLVLGAFLFRAGAPGPHADTLPAFVAQTLEQTPSGETQLEPAKGWQVMPLASYQSADGRLCREYAGRTGDDTVFGLACRSGPKEWQILVSEKHTPSAGYQPASGPAGGVAAVLDRLQAGEPLTPEEEAVRLGWPTE